MKALGIVVGSLLALSGAAAAVSPGEITFTAAKTYPKVDRLYGVRSDGTGLRVILRDVSHPAWSPDGRRFVFYGRHGFYVADAKAGHVRLVLGASCGFGSDDAWSPDGSRLALACNTTGTALHSRVVVVRADGGNAHRVRVAAGAGDPQLAGLAWSPHGTSLAFYETRLSRANRLQGSLFTVAVSGGRVRTLAAIHGFVSVDEHPSWRTGGRVLAFRTDARHFALLDVARRRVTRVVRGTSPMFSPDGRRLAFARDGEYVAMADGSGAVRVADAVLAAWSPDSRELAYLGDSGIRVVGADGRHRRTLTSSSYVDMLDVEWRP